jgi:hypothetical protein
MKVDGEGEHVDLTDKEISKIKKIIGAWWREWGNPLFFLLFFGYIYEVFTKQNSFQIKGWQ